MVPSKFLQPVIQQSACLSHAGMETSCMNLPYFSNLRTFASGAEGFYWHIPMGTASLFQSRQGRTRGTIHEMREKSAFWRWFKTQEVSMRQNACLLGGNDLQSIIERKEARWQKSDVLSEYNMRVRVCTCVCLHACLPMYIRMWGVSNQVSCQLIFGSHQPLFNQLHP